jgi:hypothetical protein
LGAQTTRINDGTDTALVTAAGALVVDGSGSTQPVSGTVAATQSGAWNITNVSGTVSLPTGASTSALQTTGNTSLNNIDTDLDVALSTRLADATFTGRFPASATLTDTTANPSLTASASYLMGYNGTTWDRLRKSASGLLVDITNTSLAVTQSGTWNVGQTGTWNVGLSAGTNYVGKTRLTDGTLDVTLLNSAPGTDTGQVSVPVRIISSLAGGAGGTSSSYGASIPATGTAAGFSDGTNMQGARVFDADTGGGTQYLLGANLRVSASGGSTEAAAGAGAVSASTLRVVLPTDQTAIPVTDNGGVLTVDGTVAVSSVGGTVTVSGTVDTELPTAATLADATANPSTTSVGSLNLLYNGSTWDRMRGDTTNGLLVNLGANNDVTVTGTVTANAGTGNFTVVQSTASSLRTQTSAEAATNAAAPANGVLVGFTDTSGNIQPGTVIDQDSSGAVRWAQGVAIIGQGFGAGNQPQAGVSGSISTSTGASTGLVVRPVLKTATTPTTTDVSCGATATLMPTAVLTNRTSLCAYNNGSNTVFIGGSGVTTSNGLPLPTGAYWCDDTQTVVYYCIVAAGTESVRVLEN